MSSVASPGALPSPIKKNEFGIGGDAISCCLEGLEFETFCTVESPIQFPHPTLTVSMQIWTNNEAHIFKKWGCMYPQTPWLPSGIIQFMLRETYSIA